MSGTETEQLTPEGASPPPVDSQHDDSEARARAMGWRPRNEWRGPDERWVDARTFIERGEQIIPVARERNAHLERRLNEQNTQIAEMRELMAQQLERQRRAEQIGYKRAMRELEEKKAEAVRNADPVEVAKVDAAIRDMGPDPVYEDAQRAARQQTPQPQPTQQNAPDPIVVDWVDDNPWVTQNPQAWDMAVVTLNRVRAERPRSSLEDQLAEVKRRVMPLFVNGVASDRRQDPPAVSRSGAGPTNQRVRPRTFEALPLDVQRQYEKEKRALAGKGPELTKAEFAEYYYEQFPEEP